MKLVTKTIRVIPNGNHRATTCPIAVGISEAFGIRLVPSGNGRSGIGVCSAFMNVTGYRDPENAARKDIRTPTELGTWLRCYDAGDPMGEFTYDLTLGQWEPGDDVEVQVS